MNKLNANSCRICLKSKSRQHNHSLFSGLTDNDLIEMVKYVSGVELFHADDLPDRICRTCIKQLEAAARIKRICIENNQKLLNVLENLEKNLVTYTITEIQEIDLCKSEIQETDTNLENVDFDTQSVEHENGHSEKDPVKDPVIDENANRCSSNPEPKPKKRKVLQENVENDQDKPTDDENPTNCDACGLNFENASKVTEHIRFDHLNVRYQCGYCRQPFFCRSGLDIHLPIHEKVRNKREKKFVCQICGVRYTTERALYLHIGQNCCPNQFQCAKCYEGFEYRKDLTKHIRTNKNCALEGLD